ncbi:MAG: peptidylprolyl isomerase [bacterium]|nr:peptidylprolyl isomerase [bacterium]
MANAQVGDRVKVHYKGFLENGEQFDSSEGQDPLEFVLGEQMVIQGFDQGVLGMDIGETRKLTIPPEEAYGARNDQLIGEVEKDQLPQDEPPEVGMVYNLNTPQGPFPVRVVDVAEKTVTLDGNHPLADQTLIFEIELVEVDGPKIDIMAP